MSRHSVSTSRNLTLTEELEKLEQSITLTLQEIDHNFSKAHRIVISSILPVVEQYGEHSRNVWEGSKFWKHFFEASANVSLSGYEEAPLEEDLTNTGTMSTHDTTLETPERQEGDDTITEDNGADYEGDLEEDASIIDSPSNATGVHSTPQLGSTAKARAMAKGKSVFSPTPPRSSVPRLPVRQGPSSEEPSTPRPQTTGHFADSSPFEPPSAYQLGTAQRQQSTDPLLHRVLDKNYRIQATPHTNRKTARPAPAGKTTPATATQKTRFMDSSPMSSPEVAAPQLRSDLFSPQAPGSIKRSRAPLTPGVSVQTPGQRTTTSTGRALYTGATQTTARTPALWDSDSDDEDLGMSPPKTMQFAVPQSRLLQTPAREASRRIVDDLLMTAGAEATDEIEGVGDGATMDFSPSLVRKRFDDEDDTF